MDRPVAKTVMDVGSPLRIRKHFFDTRLDSVCKVYPKSGCFGFILISRSQNINFEMRMETWLSIHSAMPEYDR